MEPESIKTICETVAITSFCFLTMFMVFIVYRLSMKTLNDMHIELMDVQKRNRETKDGQVS